MEGPNGETPGGESSREEIVIRAIGLQKKYPRVQALRGVSLEIRKREVFCVIGPNGSGKTTLLYLLGGVILPSAGHVTVFGLHRWKENYEIRRRSTILPVDVPFGASSTPYEYLRFLAQIYELPKETFLERLDRLARDMQYVPYLNKPFHELSTGLVKKAGLIGCFLPYAELRILDEPFAGGIDPLGMERLYQWMAEARRRGETIVFSTPVLDQAEVVADRLALLAEGNIAAVGAPRDLIAAAGVAPDGPRPLAKAFLALTGSESPRES
jgi:ABC-2 type transport system ATP-binding protein